MELRSLLGVKKPAIKAKPNAEIVAFNKPLDQTQSNHKDEEAKDAI